MSDTTWDAVMNKIRSMANRDTPVYAIDISSDGNDRWQCPCCKEWWYGKKLLLGLRAEDEIQLIRWCRRAK